MLKYSLLTILLVALGSCLPDLRPVDPDLLAFPKMKDGYKICVIGDGGTGKESQFRVADALYNENCDQIRYTGDVIYESGLTSEDDPQFMSKFYEPYQKIMEAGTPIFLMMGNHDFKGEPKTWLKVAKKYDNLYFQNFWYAETWDDVCFLTIEPVMYKVFGQEKWLKNIKEKMPNCKLTITGSHYPYKSVGKHGSAKWPMKPFLENNVIGHSDVYIAGHDHNLSDEGVVKGTRLLVSGAAGKLRPLRKKPAPGNFAISAYGWINLIIKRDGDKVWADYEFRVIPEEGDIRARTIRTGTIPANGWRQPDWSQEQREEERDRRRERCRRGPRRRC